MAKMDQNPKYGSKSIKWIKIQKIDQNKPWNKKVLTKNYKIGYVLTFVMLGHPALYIILSYLLAPLFPRLFAAS